MCLLQGWIFIGILAFGMVAYVGGGAGYAVFNLGVAFGPAALPHQSFWVGLGGLVLDGSRFAAAQAAEKIQGLRACGQAGTTRAGANGNESLMAGAAASETVAAAGGAAGGGSSDSDSDSDDVE